MRNESNCRFCKKIFYIEHGNQVYCSQKCRELQKAAIQKKLYKIYKDFRLGFTKNYKILETILPEKGGISKSLYEMNLKGFNCDCFFGIRKDDKGKIWHFIAHYRFNISINDKFPQIEIVHA